MITPSTVERMLSAMTSVVVVTSRTAVGSPTSSWTSNTVELPTLTVTCFARKVRNPLCSTVTAYSPGSRFCRLKPPLSLVVVKTLAFVATFRAVTFAPNTTAPAGSVTLPSKAPRMCCALIAGAVRNRQAIAKTLRITWTNLGRFIVDSFRLMRTLAADFRRRHGSGLQCWRN